jgi:hypothetical protein
MQSAETLARTTADGLQNISNNTDAITAEARTRADAQQKLAADGCEATTEQMQQKL